MTINKSISKSFQPSDYLFSLRTTLRLSNDFFKSIHDDTLSRIHETMPDSKQYVADKFQLAAPKRIVSWQVGKNKSKMWSED